MSKIIEMELTPDARQKTFDKKELSVKTLKELYVNLLKPRMIEEKMLSQLRQGKISKWFSGIGQEAISVGLAMAMKKDEYILPMHRNLGIFTSRDVPLKRLFAQFQGKASGFTNGRDRSFHFGSKEHHIVGMISHLGSQMGVADGIALARKLSKEKSVTAVITGDGGASQGDFHESVNTAAVWNLPVMIVVENNGYGLSTPSSQQFKFKSFTEKGVGYGIETLQLAGNNILEVYRELSSLAESIRHNPRPVLVECLTFRMRGHEEASGTKYVPKDLMNYWGRRDPVDNYENYLFDEGVLSTEEIHTIREEIRSEINSELKKAYTEEPIEADLEKELRDVYCDFDFKEFQSEVKSSEMRFVDAIADGLNQSMKKHHNLVLMGQDIADYGGVFKVTEGMLESYGEDRVRNTPLCEAAILGTALGLSICGYKSMVEMQFADFVSEGFNQIVNNLAKVHYRWGQNADVVVRMPTGAGVQAGPFHSQSNEAWFTHVPGLKVVYPAFPEDAKGLLITAFEDPNPIMFFEHKALYRSLKSDVPEGYYNIPFGSARICTEGTDITLITYGMGVHWALELNKNLDASLEIIDLRTLVPLDKETIFSSVKKTGRALILHEDTVFGGIGGEISALISENCFETLDAPVRRCGSIDTPVPFTGVLEDQFLAKSKLKRTVLELLEY